MLNSLNNKVIVSIAAVLVLGVFISAFVVVVTVRYQMSGKYTIEKQASIEAMSLSLADDLYAGNVDQLEKSMKSLLVYENIVSIAVYDTSGNAVASISEAESTDGNDVEYSRHTLYANGQPAGSFLAGFSDRYINDLVNNTIIILILAVAGFLLVTGLTFYVFIRRSVLYPVRQFTGAVERMNANNLSERVYIQKNDEIGFLAKAFNTMAANLEQTQTDLKRSRDELEIKVEERTQGERRRADQLRTINDVGRHISSFLSMEDLLPYVANSLHDTFSYYNVNVFLTRDGEDSIELRAGTGGYAGAVPVGLSIVSGSGITGAVLREKMSVCIVDVSGEPRYIASNDLPETRSELAVPISLGEDIFGVLDIQSDAIDAFDEIDVFTVETIAAQLAVAIQNVRYTRETRDMAVLTERNRMAREIHDTLAQGFTGIVLQLEAAEQSLDEDPERSRKHLDTARQLARESLNEARRSVWALRPQVLEDRTFAEAVRSEGEQFARDNNIQLSVEISEGIGSLDLNAENGLLRIYQEALNNIRNHAGAHHVTVSLEDDAGSLILTVTDDGIGFDEEQDMQGRFGLISMRERARLLGGTFAISSTPGEGTKLSVTVPMEARR